MNPLRVVDAVRRAAERDPGCACLVFHERPADPEPVTYGRLCDEIEPLARGLGTLGLPDGDPVVLLARSTPAFVSAFLALQEAGLVAVPTPPPEPGESGAGARQRLADVLARTRARLLVDPRPAGDADALAEYLAGRGVTLAEPARLRETGEGAPRRRVAPSPFAYCQFTSGSGGRAKGVLLTHDNLVAFLGARAAGLGLRDDDVAVSWLPLYHDMGLVGYVLLPLLGAPPAHLMPTAAFLTRPASWLALIGRVRGTLSVAPNAAYGLCVRRVSDEELARLDLSSWRMAYNGSEPVTREVVEAFARRFEVAGFRASAMVPAYGLAENTLTATARRPGQGCRFEDVSRDALEQDGLARPCRVGEAGRTIASVGSPLPGQEIRIAGPDGASLGERRVGEVLLRGPTLMHGYLPGTEGTLAIGPDGWLRTGDLGYLADGELFLVGRTKDLIIRLGRNYHPEDLEGAAGGVAGVRAGRVVAFATPGPQRERVVVAAEVRSSGEGPAALRAAIEAAVFGAVRFMPDEVLLLAPHTLPLTTSGKVMRPETRRRYEAGELAGS